MGGVSALRDAASGENPIPHVTVMPTVLSDPPFVVYLVLCAVVVALGAVWASKRNRRVLIATAVAAVVLLLVFLIDRTSVSPREEAVRRATAMASAADAKDPMAFIANLGDTVEFTSGQQPVKVSKDQLRTSNFWGMLRQYNVRVTAWDFSRENVKVIDDNTIEIGFMAKGEAEGKPYPLFVRATFTKQSNGAFKLTKFGTFSPTNHDEPLAIPNFP